MHPHRRLSARMTIHNTSTTPAVALAQPVNQPILKLALDVHVQSIVVAAMADAVLKPVRRFNPPEFLSWVKSQRAAGWVIVSCYEAGPFSPPLAPVAAPFQHDLGWTLQRLKVLSESNRRVTGNPGFLDRLPSLVHSGKYTIRFMIIDANAVHNRVLSVLTPSYYAASIPFHVI